MKKTYLTDVYETFLFKLKDYKILNEDLTAEILGDTLFSAFKSASVMFRYCRKNLEPKEDDLGFYVEELSAMEEEILTEYMLVSYVKSNVLLSSNVLAQAYNDSNFRILSQANHMKELSALIRWIKREANKLQTAYGYGDIEDKEWEV